MKATLNNTDAFRFINIFMVPAIKKSLDAVGIKYPKDSSKAKSEIYDIIFKLRHNGELVTTSPTLYYAGSDSIALSLHKMMYSKNILTIKDGKIYIISCMKLQNNWRNTEVVKIDKRSYIDGIGESAQLSRVNIEWIANNADIVIDMPNDIYTEYMKNMEMISCNK